MKFPLVPLLALLVKLAPVFSAATGLSQSIEDYGLISKLTMGQVYDGSIDLDTAVEDMTINYSGVFEQWLDVEKNLNNMMADLVKEGRNWGEVQTVIVDCKDALQKLHENLGDNLNFILDQSEEALDEAALPDILLAHHFLNSNAYISRLQTFSTFLQAVKESGQEEAISGVLFPAVWNYYNHHFALMTRSEELLHKVSAIRKDFSVLKRPSSRDLYQRLLHSATTTIPNAFHAMIEAKTRLCQVVAQEKFNLHHPEAFELLMLEGANAALKKVEESLELLVSDHTHLAHTSEDYQIPEDVDVETLTGQMQPLLEEYPKICTTHHEMLLAAFEGLDADPQYEEDPVFPALGRKREQNPLPDDEPPRKRKGRVEQD